MRIIILFLETVHIHISTYLCRAYYFYCLEIYFLSVNYLDFLCEAL